MEVGFRTGSSSGLIFAAGSSFSGAGVFCCGVSDFTSFESLADGVGGSGDAAPVGTGAPGRAAAVGVVAPVGTGAPGGKDGADAATGVVAPVGTGAPGAVRGGGRVGFGPSVFLSTTAPKPPGVTIDLAPGGSFGPVCGAGDAAPPAAAASPGLEGVPAGCGDVAPAGAGSPGLCTANHKSHHHATLYQY